MCLYPNLVLNPKYKPNKKNNYNPPPINDERVKYVPIGCGKCIECRKQKARNWQLRLYEEIRKGDKAYFITLTFNTESYVKYYKLLKDTNLPAYDIDNKLVTLSIRRFLERWRKHNGKSLRHWLVTELGHENTEHIHLHGIVWTNLNPSLIEKIWQNGYVWVGDKPSNYVNNKTINYIIKYVTAVDEKHKYYNPIVLCSKGIGANYTNTYNSKLNKYNDQNTDELYKTSTGHKIALPIYYRNKIYDDDQKEKLWTYKLDKNTRYVLGKKIDISNGDEEYYRALKHAQIKNKRLGYGDDIINWDLKEYENKCRLLKQLQRGAITEEIMQSRLQQFKRYRKLKE